MRRVLERACWLPPERIASVRGFARSLPAAAPRGPGVPPVASMTFGLVLWRLLAVRNLDRGTVCRLVGWPETLLYGLTVGRVEPTPRWVTVLGGVLDLRTDDPAALAGMPPPEGTPSRTAPAPCLGGAIGSGRATGPDVRHPRSPARPRPARAVVGRGRRGRRRRARR
ncbi:hypothetical protein Voc01_029840 [Virgisporangium ochraceum]|uniref:Uncharacterized protein n=1 Tax=Virgisporangium ochraceum TaxID=65505 RepID=A0A8J4EDL3_9ACTN|nr:hypothetical protein Voc01_029840 [Virgisporangium ochraceum]